MMLHRRLAITLGCLLLFTASADAQQAAARVDFNSQIRPILNANCTSCHGGVKQAAGVSFIYREQSIDAGIIVPGSPEDSELIARVVTEDPDLRMPPVDEHPAPLPPEQIALLKQWIAEGAPWGEHWALEGPALTVVPATVAQDPWIRQPLDAFVLARLRSEGLTPAPVAAPEEWLRRVSLDLTGLPPTLEERQAFLDELQATDPTQQESAYEAVVTRLLASEHYGERWAALWLDLARYADTMGFEKDPHRDMWPYRDWLIRVFNQDMPFDEFTIKQLAGDLLPEPTADDLIATAFHRNTQTNTEGGTDDEEFRIAAVIDRMNTTWTVWQATTFGCVQCHSHPYDPIRHEEFYQFMAFFNNTEDHDLDNDYPTLSLPADRQQAERAVELERELRRLRSDLNESGRALAIKLDGKSGWEPLAITSVASSHGKLKLENGIEVRTDGGTFPPGCHYTLRAPASPLTAIRVWILPESDDATKWPEDGAVISQFQAAWVLPDGTRQELTWKEVFVDHLAGPYEPQQARDASVEGVGGYPKLFGPRWAVFAVDQTAAPPDGAELEIVVHQRAQTTGNRPVHLRRMRLEQSNDPAWTHMVSDEARADQWKRYHEQTEQRQQFKGTTLPVIRQRPAEAKRETRVFLRGNWLDHGDRVEPGVPSILPQIARESPSRLEMAKWLVSSENPLTARVITNRLWAALFGIGIVETLEDFGSTGTPPTHPALLDHLAIRLQHDHQWHWKPFLREIVLSATYRQSNRTTPELQQRDPRNQLLARGPRTRLTAEMVRDQALVAAGLITRRIGGPSVMPPQPDGVWRTVYSSASWQTATGPDRYRRGLYTYWRRTSPYPSFLMFDAPSREFCSARRVPTNTPLQALVTLNDPVYVECAQALARQSDVTPAAAIRQMFVAVTQHEPDTQTLETLLTLYHEAIAEAAESPEVTGALAERPAEYARAILANTILNLDLALTK